MNERIKELALQAGFTVTPCGLFEAEDINLERFADLVRQDECDAVIDIVARHGGSVEIEAAVRQRGEK